MSPRPTTRLPRLGPLAVYTVVVVAGLAWIALSPTLRRGPDPGLGADPRSDLQGEPWDCGQASDALRERWGPRAGERLCSLAVETSVEDGAVVNPYAGRALREHRVDAGNGASITLRLPEGLVARLAATVPGDPEPHRALLHVADRARGAVYDPEELLSETPERWPRVRAAMVRGMAHELASLACGLPDRPAFGPPLRVLVTGEIQAALSGLEQQDAGGWREAAAYTAWRELLVGWLRERDLPHRVFSIHLERGAWQPARDPLSRSLGRTRTWHPGWFDFEAWFEAGPPPGVRAGDGAALPRRDPDPHGEARQRPFFELGRVYGLALAQQLGLVETWYIGHGWRVSREDVAEDRFTPFALHPVRPGDEFQEILRAGSGEGSFTVRYGLCLDRRRPFMALSCSNRSDSHTSPQENAAAVAFFLANGHFSDMRSLDLPAFRLFTRIREARDRAEEEQALVPELSEEIREEADGLVAAPLLRHVVRVADRLWWLETGGAEVPDAVLVLPGAAPPAPRDLHRLRILGTTWRAWESVSPPGTRRRTWHEADLVSPCSDPGSCASNLDRLVAWDLDPTRPSLERSRVPIRFGDREVRVSAEPDRSHPFVRVLLVRAPGESDGDLLRRAWKLTRRWPGPRIQGLVLLETSGERLWPPPAMR